MKNVHIPVQNSDIEPIILSTTDNLAKKRIKKIIFKKNYTCFIDKVVPPGMSAT